MNKWGGESGKMVLTLFVVDSLLFAHSEKDGYYTQRLKTEFLVQLNGVKSINDELVLVIGATNRREELEKAVNDDMSIGCGPPMIV